MNISRADYGLCVFNNIPKQVRWKVKERPDGCEPPERKGLIPLAGISSGKVIRYVLSAYRSFFFLQGSYWAIDTNPKEDALPTRPKKRPRSGERVRETHAPFT